MILPHDANPGRIKFSERTPSELGEAGDFSPFRAPPAGEPSAPQWLSSNMQTARQALQCAARLPDERIALLPLRCVHRARRSRQLQHRRVLAFVRFYPERVETKSVGVGRPTKTEADQRLNAVFSSLIAKISAAGKASLRDAEKTWIGFRDQECAFETMASVGGSVHPMVVSQCKSRLTIQRTKDLEGQLNCKEGDLSCGGQ
jgi:Lysozyme inhibitor LprI